MRLKTEAFGAGDQSWLNSAHGTDHAATATVVVANFTKDTHYPTGVLKSGTPVNIADRANVKPWTDETGAKLGFVLFDQAVDAGDANVAIPVLVHGAVRTKHLPVTFTVPTTAPQAQFVFNEGSDA